MVWFIPVLFSFINLILLSFNPGLVWYSSVRYGSLGRVKVGAQRSAFPQGRMDKGTVHPGMLLCYEIPDSR